MKQLIKAERVKVMKNQFTSMNLSKEIIKSIQTLGYKEATPVQEKTIPIILSGKDLVVQSQTGSGKTAAFTIPICEKIVWNNRKPQALIIAPTRELVMQIQEDVFNIGRFKRIKSEAIFGRSSFETQAKKLREMTHVVVATPGRLIDHIERETIDLSSIEMVVIDEADELFNMGFLDQLETVLKATPVTSQKLFFSATIPEAIKIFMGQYLNNAETILIQSENPVANRINQGHCKTYNFDKTAVLEKFLVVHNPNAAIIFCNTKEQVIMLTQSLQEKDIQVDCIHGDMEQRDRTEVMRDFKRGKFRYLVATDIAARGIDIDDIALVVNYDVPENVESYTHRIGRSARHTKTGSALTLWCPNEAKFMDNILNTLDDTIQEFKIPKDTLVEEKLPLFVAKQKRQIKKKLDKTQGFKKEITRIHINAGKKSKMRPVDIVGALTALPNVDAKDIGVIEIIDVASFVEILNNKGDLVIKSLKTKPIKGKIRKVSKVYHQ